MFPPKEILLNLAILLPPVAKAARKRHHTGIDCDPQAGEEVYRRIREHVDPSGKDVVDLGPGQTPFLLQWALRDGARSAVGLDVEPYDWPPRIARHLYDGKRMPLPDSSTDVVWSNACLEHVRYPELTITECYRVLRPGGITLGSVDLKDHYHGTVPELAAEHLRHPEWLWNAMTWNRSAYTNRVRASEWRRLLEAAGFAVRVCKLEFSDTLRSVYARHPARTRYSEEDFAAVGLYFVAEKPRAT